MARMQAASEIDISGFFGATVSLLAVVYIQRRQGILRNKFTQFATVAFALLVAYTWSPIGAPTSDWARAPIGTDVYRLIPILDFDSALLQTAWLPIQLLLSASTFLLAIIALYGDAHRAKFVVIVIMAVGLEIAQAAANVILQPANPYRVDIHDVLVRAAGAYLAFGLLTLFAAIYRWAAPSRGTPKGLFGFVDNLVRRI
jgi:hypothetical protein